MSLSFTPFTAALRSVRSAVAAYKADQKGNVAVMTALLLPALVGVTGLGVEGGYWYLTQRDMQNAADSAVTAAATVAGSKYDDEAKAVAARYGFKHNINGVSVVTSNNETCPPGSTSASPAPKCYSVKITGYVPLFLSRVVGFSGTDVGPTINDATPKRRQALSVASIAIQHATPRKYCVISLGGDGVTFETNGAPKANLKGCSIMSNGGADCNGHNLLADYGDAVLTNDGCGIVPRSNVAPIEDLYEARWKNSTDTQLTTNSCGSYPKVPSKNKDPIPSNLTQWPPAGGTKTLPQPPLSGTQATPVCGDLLLTADTIVVTPPGGAVLVIWNGNLEFGSHTLKTADGSALTIIFAGNTPGVPNGEKDGKLDIVAPSSGAWAGIALYQVKKPLVGASVKIGEAGNGPAWTITGMVYLPNSEILFSGAVNKASYGKSCFVLVVKAIRINGTASMLDQGECDHIGLEMPTGYIIRGRLVS